MNFVIIDYQMGNLNSVYKKIKGLGASVKIASKADEVYEADKIILPGVGHFGKAMENLKKLNLIETLNEKVLVKHTPILGICLGMQLMARCSEEGDALGLNWIDAEVLKFNVKDTLRYKIPHIGWNQINIVKESQLMNRIPQEAEFYFVHSYFVQTKNSNDNLNVTAYETEFTSAFEKDNIFGVQYHPEKSHDVGEQLLKNFIEL